MRIINVSADLHSQKNIALMGMASVANKAAEEEYDAARVEVQEDKTAQGTQKKGRKAKRVPDEEV